MSLVKFAASNLPLDRGGGMSRQQTSRRCGVRYGSRRELVCRRPAGHGGPHAKQFTISDLNRLRGGAA